MVSTLVDQRSDVKMFKSQVKPRAACEWFHCRGLRRGACVTPTRATAKETRWNDGYPRYFHMRIFPGPQTSLIIGFWIRIWVSEGFETKGMLGQPQTLWEVYFNVVYHAAVFVLSRKWRDEEGGRHCMTRQKRLCRRLSLIHHLRNEEETGTSSLLQRPVGWLLGTRYSSIGQFFPPVPSNNPRSLCKS